MTTAAPDALWEGFVGSPRIMQVLRAAAQEPGDSYLLSGPRGAGAEDAGRRFAASIICDDRSEGCETCRRVMQGIHPDVAVFQPEGYTYPVAVIREMATAAAQTPLEAQRRVFIVEEADRIAERSQNALLKALEEPGASVTWILLANALDPFLDTILSRCKLIEIPPMPEEAVRESIVALGISESEAAPLVRAARGDITLARALAEEGPRRSLRWLAVEAAVLPGSDPADAFQLMARLSSLIDEAKASASEAQASEIAALEESIGSGRGTAAVRKRVTDRHKRELRRLENDLYLEFIGWLGVAFRDLAALTLGADPEDLVGADAAANLLDIANDSSTQTWLRLIDEGQSATLAITENANAPMAVEALLMKIAAC